MADLTYTSKVYRQQGGVRFVVASSGTLDVEEGGAIDIESGGHLDIGGTPFISSGGGIALGSLTSGSISSTGSITATVGIAGSSGTFTNGISASSGTFTGALAVGGALSLTTGVQATTGNFSGGVAISSALSVGAHLTLTSGLGGTTGAFTGGVAMSSAVVTNGITGSSISVTNGISGGTGGFSGAVTVSNDLTANRAFYRYLETATSSATSVVSYGISIVKSTEDTEHIMALGAPAAGIEKYIVCNEVLKSSGVSTGAAIITSSGSTSAIGAYTSILFTTGASNNQWIHLLGQNSTNWVLIGRSTDVTLSAT